MRLKRALVSGFHVRLKRLQLKGRDLVVHAFPAGESNFGLSSFAGMAVLE